MNFQLTTLNGCSITGWSFYSQIRSRNFDTGWVLCHISAVFSLKLDKLHPKIIILKKQTKLLSYKLQNYLSLLPRPQT